MKKNTFEEIPGANYFSPECILEGKKAATFFLRKKNPDYTLTTILGENYFLIKKIIHVEIDEPGAKYRVDGHTVRYLGSGDGDPDYVSYWGCDCGAEDEDECIHLVAVYTVCDFEDRQL